MRDLINEFATQYVADLQRQLDSGYGQRSLQNPVLFLFIGDKSVEALRAVCASNERDWQNSRGVLYMHAYQEKTWEHPQVLGCRRRMRTRRRCAHRSTSVLSRTKPAKWN